MNILMCLFINGMSFICYTNTYDNQHNISRCYKSVLYLITCKRVHYNRR